MGVKLDSFFIMTSSLISCSQKWLDYALSLVWEVFKSRYPQIQHVREKCVNASVNDWLFQALRRKFKEKVFILSLYVFIKYYSFSFTFTNLSMFQIMVFSRNSLSILKFFFFYKIYNCKYIFQLKSLCLFIIWTFLKSGNSRQKLSNSNYELNLY